MFVTFGLSIYTWMPKPIWKQYKNRLKRGAVKHHRIRCYVKGKKEFSVTLRIIFSDVSHMFVFMIACFFIHLCTSGSYHQLLAWRVYYSVLWTVHRSFSSVAICTGNCFTTNLPYAGTNPVFHSCRGPIVYKQMLSAITLLPPRSPWPLPPSHNTLDQSDIN